MHNYGGYCLIRGVYCVLPGIISSAIFVNLAVLKCSTCKQALDIGTCVATLVNKNKQNLPNIQHTSPMNAWRSLIDVLYLHITLDSNTVSPDECWGIPHCNAKFTYKT